MRLGHVTVKEQEELHIGMYWKRWIKFMCTAFSSSIQYEWWCDGWQYLNITAAWLLHYCYYTVAYSMSLLHTWIDVISEICSEDSRNLRFCHRCTTISVFLILFTFFSIDLGWTSICFPVNPPHCSITANYNIKLYMVAICNWTFLPQINMPVDGTWKMIQCFTSQLQDLFNDLSGEVKRR